MRTGQDLTISRLVGDTMVEHIHYAPAHSQYLPSHAHHSHPHPYYQPAPISHQPPTHVVSGPTLQRTEPPQRKRPKYTRSKTGCMTCRVKKIKCDETKPNCMRCTHGQRDCTWPEGVPARKKSAGKKEQPAAVETRPSTAGSSGISEGSTPPTREHSPPRRSSTDINLVPMPSSRRSADQYALHPVPAEHDPARRVPLHTTDRPHSQSGYSHHSQHGSPALSMLPEPSQYPPAPRYEQSYAPSSHQSSRSSGFRPLNHDPVHWNNTSSDYDRNIVPHLPNDPHTRYQ